ncbi:hypothetical protein [Pseudomonas lini]|uniref:hypothetical protein n=1 Tax=Pseudomonas lini TaxID=163011 RepID=UPI0006837684|nr:hypothetical protein [Pseudomonas lini]KNH47350.1 hypothetical protein ACS73_06235 [Pseudomonas lini]
MLAICKSNFGAAIPLSGRYLGETDQTSYSPLAVGEGYLVFALFFVFDRVDFLISGPEQLPFWVPGNLFDLTDAKIPPGWEFRSTRLDSDYKILFEAFGISYIFGYPQLVNEYQHYAGIVEHDSNALQIFADEKKRVSEWWSEVIAVK